jgi:hydroxyethylthiazole kinase-like sugar kinase family protein
MPTFFINSDSFKASNAFVATLGAAPGSTYLGQIIAAGLPTAANAMLAAMAATTAATRADAIAANLGLTGTAATTASTYLQTVQPRLTDRAC